MVRPWEIIHVPELVECDHEAFESAEDVEQAMRDGTLRCGVILAHGPKRYVVYRRGGRDVCLLRVRLNYELGTWLAVADSFSHCVEV